MHLKKLGLLWAFGEQGHCRWGSAQGSSPWIPWRPASQASSYLNSRLRLLSSLICSRNRRQLCAGVLLVASVCNLAKLFRNLCYLLVMATAGALLDHRLLLWSGSTCLSCFLRYCLLMLLVFCPQLLQELGLLASFVSMGHFCCW